MKFWTIENHCGETLGCELTKRDAIAFGKSYGYKRDEFTVECVECEVTAETVRRLLGNLGGYAKATGEQA